MRTAQLLLLSAVCIFVLAYHGTAQDSTATTLLLGRVSLKKEFTQSITIKGTDLERMPFASLSDALQAWSFGYLANNTNVVYAVDGIVINDVNVYSKYDIEEVVLVQNAVSTLNGATATQILALVKTRKSGPKPSGFTVAGQSYLVKADPKQYYLPPATTESGTNFFHNYHVAGYLNTQSIQLHVSANYLHDVAPGFPTTTLRIAKPQTTDRFGLNASLHARLARAHELTVRINATPQHSDYDDPLKTTSSFPGYYDAYREKATLINPSATLQSTLLKGLTNELTASFLTGKGTMTGDRDFINGQGGTTYYKLRNTTKAQQWVVMDNLTYHTPLHNGWALEPSLNLFYRHVKYDMESISSSQSPGGGLGGGISYSSETRHQNGGIFLVTPSVNLYYRKFFNFQAGVQTNLSKTQGTDINKVLPFATTSIDVVKLFRPLGGTSLQLFGSIGQSDNLGDLKLNLSTTQYVPSVGFVSFLPTILPFQRKESMWNWQSGARLGLWDGRLTANYVYESRSYLATFVVQLPPNPMPTLIITERLVKSHNINLQWQVLNRQSITWRTSLSATASRDEIKGLRFPNPITSLPGLSLGSKTVWNGGWANRVAIQQFTAGVDVLCYFSPAAFSNGLGAAGTDAVSLTNVYLGYVLPLKGNRTLELYANTRNPVQDKDLNNIESFKYYGLGFKAAL